jgi:hypothetical protein
MIIVLFNYLFLWLLFIIIKMLDPSCKAMHIFSLVLFDIIYWLLHVWLQILLD